MIQPGGRLGNGGLCGARKQNQVSVFRRVVQKDEVRNILDQPIIRCA